jgi:hypothetical protein
MPKVRGLFKNFVFLAMIGSFGVASADGISPGYARFDDGNLGFQQQYSRYTIDAPVGDGVEQTENMHFYNRIAPGQFCPNPSTPFAANGFIAAPVTGLDGAGPFQILAVRVRGDNEWYETMPASSTTRGPDTIHYLTDWAPNTGWTFLQWEENFNFTTVAFPGEVTLSYPKGPSTSIPGSQRWSILTAIGPGFNHAGVENRVFPDAFFGFPVLNSGTCDAPDFGGLLIMMQSHSFSAHSSAENISDADFTPAWSGTNAGFFRHTEIRYGIDSGFNGNPNGFMTFVGTTSAFTYNLITEGCITYSDLKKAIDDAVITGQPSDPQGIRNALKKKAINSEAAFNRGRFNSAGNTLGALLNHISAQRGKHLSADSAGDLEDCIELMGAILGLEVK